MPTMKEITLTDFCPGCYQDAMIENPLIQQPGGFIGIYCIRPGSTPNDKGHVYADTSELRDEMAKANKLRTQFKKKAKDVSKPEPPVEASTLEEPKAEVISTVEPKAFEVTEMDAARLTELLGQPITDAGTLVGACYSIKITAAAEQGLVERQAASVSSVGTSIAIDQKQDGRLLVQIFLPWATGKSMVEKAIFNNTSLQDVVQNMIEYVMQSMFPWNTESSGEVLPPYAGFWMVVAIPELYVGTLMDQAVAMGMTPTEYMQAWITDAIKMEQFQ